MTVFSGAPVAIILAAGRSSRAGRDKLFEPLGGEAMVERVVNTHLRARRIEDVVLVIPPGRTEDFAWMRSVHIHVIENPEPDQGMISSIRVALRSVWLEGRDFLICPADVPFVPTEIINKVIQTYLARPCSIVLPTYKGLGGHPGMYAARLHDDFLLHGGSRGTREILIRHRADTVRLNVPDPDVCFDVDTDEDLRIAEDPGARWARVDKLAEEKKLGRMR